MVGRYVRVGVCVTALVGATDFALDGSTRDCVAIAAFKLRWVTSFDPDSDPVLLERAALFTRERYFRRLTHRSLFGGDDAWRGVVTDAETPAQRLAVLQALVRHESPDKDCRTERERARDDVLADMLMLKQPWTLSPAATWAVVKLASGDSARHQQEWVARRALRNQMPLRAPSPSPTQRAVAAADHGGISPVLAALLQCRQFLRRNEDALPLRSSTAAVIDAFLQRALLHGQFRVGHSLKGPRARFRRQPDDATRNVRRVLLGWVGGRTQREP